MYSFLQKFGRLLVIWLPLGWLCIFFMLPLVEMVNVSMSEARRAVPPYNPAFQIGRDGISFQPVVDNYLLIYEYWEDYLWPAVNSVKLAAFPKIGELFLLIVKLLEPKLFPLSMNVTSLPIAGEAGNVTVTGAFKPPPDPEVLINN